MGEELRRDGWDLALTIAESLNFMYSLYGAKIITFDTTFRKDYNILNKFSVCPASLQHYFINHLLALLNFTLKMGIRFW